MENAILNINRIDHEGTNLAECHTSANSRFEVNSKNDSEGEFRNIHIYITLNFVCNLMFHFLTVERYMYVLDLTYIVSAICYFIVVLFTDIRCTCKRWFSAGPCADTADRSPPVDSLGSCRNTGGDH